jgi:hypothetical protein
MTDRCSLRVARLVVGVLASLSLSAAAMAQSGRVSGTVKDEEGQAIKGAVVVAETTQTAPNTFTVTTDAKGRFSVLGLKSGVWAFTATAPGYAPSQASARIQMLNPNPAIDFRLAKGASGPPAGVLVGVDTERLQADLKSAETLYANKQYDKAISAYEAIVTRLPALSAIDLQIGHIFELKKQYDDAASWYTRAAEKDPAWGKPAVKLALLEIDRNQPEAAAARLRKLIDTTEDCQHETQALARRDDVVVMAGRCGDVIEAQTLLSRLEK